MVVRYRYRDSEYCWISRAGNVPDLQRVAKESRAMIANRRLRAREDKKKEEEEEEEEAIGEVCLKECKEIDRRG